MPGTRRPTSAIGEQVASPPWTWWKDFSHRVTSSASRQRKERSRFNSQRLIAAACESRLHMDRQLKPFYWRNSIIYQVLPSELALRGPKMGAKVVTKSTLQSVTDITDGQLEFLVWGLHGAADDRCSGMMEC